MDLLESCGLHFGINAFSIPCTLSSHPETLLLHSYGKASAPHFPLLVLCIHLALVLGTLPLPATCPVPSGALLFTPQCSPQIPMSLPRPETLASSLSLSYFFLPCVQVIITALSPPSALLEVCRPFSLPLLSLSQNPHADTLPSPRGAPPAPWCVQVVLGNSHPVLLGPHNLA